GDVGGLLGTRVEDSRLMAPVEWDAERELGQAVTHHALLQALGGRGLGAGAAERDGARSGARRPERGQRAGEKAAAVELGHRPFDPFGISGMFTVLAASS